MFSSPRERPEKLIGFSGWSERAGETSNSAGIVKSFLG